MAILKFSASAVAAQIAHARACKTFLPNWNGPVDRPALILIVGNGVHLRSNGINGTTTRIVTTEQADPSFAFADGMNPFRDTDWMAQRRMAFRDLTGQFYTDILDDVQVLIDRGRGAIRLATDGHSICVFVRRASDYLIGGTYEVPSGLGGTFRVILKDACDTFAIVQNCGNCEDFDAMQPYRVPLDALMEIDDRRAAGSTWYAAAKVINLDGTPVEDTTYVTDADGSITFGAVFLTRYDDGFWGYKDMEESAGPVESRAPLSLLALLSELKDPDSYAHAWRQRCQDWAAIPDYEEGDKIKLAAPVTLTDGSTCQIVTATHYRRVRQKRRCYGIEETGGLVRLSKASLAGSELLSSAKGAASPVLAEFLAGRN
jgi:hypothetical protein